VEEFWERLTEAQATAEEIAASTTAFYTAPVVGSPHVIDREIEKIHGRLFGRIFADIRLKYSYVSLPRITPMPLARFSAPFEHPDASD